MIDLSDQADALIYEAARLLRDARRSNQRARGWTLTREAQAIISHTSFHDRVSELGYQRAPTLFWLPLEIRHQDQPIMLVLESTNES